MPTTDCLPHLVLPRQGRRATTVTFDAPATSSDGGWLLLAAVDARTQTTASLAAALTDRRDADRVTHTGLTLVRQRVLQIAAGYADANDATTLRRDPLLRRVCAPAAAVVPWLASQPTLSRLEAAASWRAVVAAQRAHEARWCATLAPDRTAPVVLDVDGTCDPTHGAQQLALFNGFYGTTMYAPLRIFDQDGALASARLRSGGHAGHHFAGPLLERLVRAVRARCPHAPIVVRGDAMFSHTATLNRLLALRRALGRVELRLGLTCNAALQRGAAPALAEAQARVALYGHPARFYDWVTYQAEPWSEPVDVVVRAEVLPTRTDLRAVVYTGAAVEARVAYDEDYAPRGDAENRIKEFKRDLAGDRLSCHRAVANALRLLLHAAAYELSHALRGHVVAAARQPPTTPRPSLGTLRCVLLKVAAVVRASARRVVIALPHAFPAARLFRAVLARVTAPS